jgi:hypothetical protein
LSVVGCAMLHADRSFCSRRCECDRGGRGVVTVVDEKDFGVELAQHGVEPPDHLCHVRRLVARGDDDGELQEISCRFRVVRRTGGGTEIDTWAAAS